MKREKKATFEERLKELEEIANKLGDPSCELEVSLQLFERGIKLSEELTKELNEAKLKVKKLLSDGSEVDFEKNEEKSGEES